MIGYILIAVGLVALVLLLKTIAPGLALPNAGSAAARHQVARKRFLTRVELDMLEHLERAFPEFRVHAQVAMGALLRSAPGLDRRSMFAARGRFSQKIVDFVLQDRVSGEVVALVELDDFTHKIDKDLARDDLTAAGGYHTIRFPANLRPDYQQVRRVVREGLELLDPSPALPSLQGVSQ